MISCLLKQVTRNQRGLAVSKDICVTGEMIDIGRAAACKIHLLDHQVYLHHATITRSEDGDLLIAGAGEAEISIDGQLERSATLKTGIKIGIGAYQLVVEPPADKHDLILRVELTQAASHLENANYKRGGAVNLEGLRVSKRKLGFGLALTILFFFLLLPILPSTSAAIDQWQAQLPVSFTSAWSAGTLSDAHSQFGAQCSSCHERPFTTISDSSCTKCHQQNTQHRPSTKKLSMAHKHAACTTCHLEHQGRQKLVLHNAQQCVNCHGDIKSKSQTATIANVSDFANGHPEFHLSLSNGEGTVVLNQAQTGMPTETPVLKFSHKVHLDKEGLSTPDGDKVLQCADCHKPDNSALHFSPISMRTTCQQSECHSPDFSLPAKGPVPHGSEQQVLGSLQLFYARWLSESPTNMASCELPNVAANQTSRSVDCAFALAKKNAGENLFGGKSRCGECHEITSADNPDVPWKITRPHIQHAWHAGAVFPHARHATQSCTDCHDKRNSDNSEDIAMPGIAKCRQCHTGATPVRGKIITDCHSCHKYHPRT